MALRVFWKIRAKWADLRRREDGLALTEYLVLLALLTSGILFMVIAIGSSLERAWIGWADWYDGGIVTATDAGDDDGADSVTPEASPDQAVPEPEAASDDDVSGGKSNGPKDKDPGKGKTPRKSE